MSDLQWTRKEHDHGAALARDCGVTPVFLSYNSGLHISQNGRAFADMLERLVAQWPTQVEEIVLLGHSMGGLVARSAVHYANLSGHGWTRKLSKMVFLGAPHHGAPLERIGSWVEGALGKIPYAAVFGRLGAVRSAGITDLRYGFLVDEDWRAADRCAHGDKARAVIPLPDRVACYAIAATTAKTTGGIWDQTIGDGLVQVASALGAHRDPALSLRFPREHTAILCETGHLDLLASQEAYATIRNWLEPA
ncbi:MAG: alpha/beta fold hydrolase [Rhodoblastus sp.]|nr:alpha/beta fold hydrolase [Rhodoblastus sp.]